MRKIRYFVPIELNIHNKIILNLEISHRIKNVIRKNKNSKIFLFNGDGNEYEAEILNINNNVEVYINKKILNSHDEKIKLSLAICLPKTNIFEAIIQKSTELNVNTIIPIISDYCEHSTVKSIKNNRNRWLKIMNQACEQCHRTSIPLLENSLNLDIFCKNNFSQDKIIILANPDNSNKKMPHIDYNKVKEIILVVGPEGGFSKKELEYFSHNTSNIHNIKLGDTILKVETAVISFLALIKYVI